MKLNPIWLLVHDDFRILEHLLEQNNIAVPARPEPKVEGDAASNPAS